MFYYKFVNLRDDSIPLSRFERNYGILTLDDAGEFMRTEDWSRRGCGGYGTLTNWSGFEEEAARRCYSSPNQAQAERDGGAKRAPLPQRRRVR